MSKGGAIGDSDSTGAITGNIVGAYLGLSSIPEEWVKKLELREAIVRIAVDLINKEQESGNVVRLSVDL